MATPSPKLEPPPPFPHLAPTPCVRPPTCRLPRGQYSVTMQMLGGSMHAPMKRVRWLNWMSLIWEGGNRQCLDVGYPWTRCCSPLCHAPWPQNHRDPSLSPHWGCPQWCPSPTTPRREPHAPPSGCPPKTYVFQLKEHLARQLDALLVDVLDGHHVALGVRRERA